LKDWLQKQMSPENIALLLDIHRYKALTKYSARKSMAQEIYASFIQNGAKYEVNLSSSLKRKVLDHMNRKATMDLFDDVEHEIMRLISTNNMEAFTSSPSFKLCCLILGHPSYKPQKARKVGGLKSTTSAARDMSSTGAGFEPTITADEKGMDSPPETSPLPRNSRALPQGLSKDRPEIKNEIAEQGSLKIISPATTTRLLPDSKTTETKNGDGSLQSSHATTTTNGTGNAVEMQTLLATTSNAVPTIPLTTSSLIVSVDTSAAQSARLSNATQPNTTAATSPATTSTTTTTTVAATPASNEVFLPA